MSVTSAMYSGSAISGVISTPSSAKTSRSTSPVDDASATMRLTCAEARVVVVVVDVDDELRALDRGRVRPDAIRLRAVDGDEDALLRCRPAARAAARRAA